MLKKISTVLLGLLSCAAIAQTSIAADKPDFKRVVILGDSLSDNGNLFRHIAGTVPAMPYYKGRFTDGYNWADRFTYKLYTDYKIPSINYAVGGATAVLRDPTKGYFPVSAAMEIADYEVKTALSDKSNTLYVIWFGANDYLKGASDVDKETTSVVNEIITSINKLIVHPNAEFLIMGLPDLSYTPGARIHHLEPVLHQLSIMHNQKLHDAVLMLRNKYPNTKFYEYGFYPLLKNMVESKSYRDEINQKYHEDITDVTTPCIGVVWHKPPTINSLNSAKIATQNGWLAGVTNSPSLSEAYHIGQSYQSAMPVCTNENQHIFWDDIHPTTAAHKVIGEMVYHQIITGQLDS